MKNRTIVMMTAVALMAGMAGAPVFAQVSDARLKELMDAAKAQQAQGPFTFSATVPTGAGPVVALTIEDAVRFALDRNLDIAVQRMNPELRDISVASALSVYHPTLGATLNRSSTTSTPTNQLNLASGGTNTTNAGLGYNASITQNLPWWGSSVRGTINNSRSDSNSNNATFNPSYTSTWSADLTVPLLRNRIIDSSRRTIYVSRVNRDISEIQLKASLTNLVSNVRNAYWDFVYTTQAVESSQQSLALSTKLVEDNTVKVEVGTLAPIDIVSARAEQATRQQQLVTAQNSRRTAELTLKRLIVSGTDDPNWVATLDPIDRPEFRPEPVDPQAAVARALAQRTDLAIIKKNLDLNENAMKLYNNNTLPTVDLGINYGLQGVGGTQLIRSNSGVLGSQVTQTIPGGVGDALAMLLKGRNPRWTMSVNFSYPLGTSSQDTAVATANVQLTQIQAQLKNIELTVANDITSAAINLTNTAQAVQAAQISRELSQQRLDAEQSKFEVGMSTNYQVVQYQRDLNDARNSELRAILNYRKAQVEWDRLQETTLGNNNIQVL